MHVYQGFSVPRFRGFPGDGFPTLARGAPILLAFLQFRAFFEPRFSVGFSMVFAADFEVA
jgi:hypothetical protein